MRSKPELSSKFWGCTHVQRKSPWVQPEGAWNCGTKLVRWVKPGQGLQKQRFRLDCPLEEESCIYSLLEDKSGDGREQYRNRTLELPDSIKYHVMTILCLEELLKGGIVGLSVFLIPVVIQSSNIRIVLRLRLWPAVALEMCCWQCGGVMGWVSSCLSFSFSVTIRAFFHLLILLGCITERSPWIKDIDLMYEGSS